MRLSIALAAVFFSSGIFCTPTPPCKVSTPYATYSGVRSGTSSLAFLGIPYAEPPLGDSRFRAPKQLNTTKFDRNTVIDASTYPKFCIQGAFFVGADAGAGTEDCLKVNIYTPVNATSHSRLPVLVYIHGGGYIEGNPQNWPFEHWINQSPNVVIVSVYYRLDAYGFLSHPLFDNSTYGDNNAGFLDQVQALTWVKQYISYFGGDPGRVTINGQSAGAGSVQFHLVSQASKGLFNGAIIQSVYRASMPSPQQQLPLFNYLASQAGCSGTAPQILDCLRSVSSDTFTRAQDASPAVNSTYNGWRPVLDGKIFVDYPTRLLQRGNFTRVPIIAGSTSNESIGAIPDLPLRNSLKPFYPQLTTQDINGIQTLYNGYHYPDQNTIVEEAVGEILLRCAREIIANASESCHTPVWTYRYNQPNPTTSPSGNTGHAAENWMMFRGINTASNGTGVFTGLNPVQKAFSQELIAYWLSFVRTFNPNTYKKSQSVYWPEYDPTTSNGKRVVLQQDPNYPTTHPGSGIKVESEPQGELARCKAIAGYSTELQI